MTPKPTEPPEEENYIYTEGIDYSQTGRTSVWGAGDIVESEVPEEEIKIRDFVYRFRCKFILLAASKKHHQV